MIFSSLLLALAAPAVASSAEDAAGANCSEVCIMQREQAAIAELMNNERPKWAITLFREMDDYIACGEKSFAKGSLVAFENFDEIDSRFDRAAVDCSDERYAVTAVMTAEFLKDGTFPQVDEASANVERTRAMAFAFSMVDKFGSTRRGSAAEKYAESRFPKLVAATRRPGTPPRATPPVAPAPAPSPPAAPMPKTGLYEPDRHAGWNPLKPDPFIAESPADAMKWELQGHSESVEGNQKLTMTIAPIDRGMLGVSLIRKGLLDDSTTAIWTYAELAPRDDGNWDVTMKGEKWRCARSGSGEWVITPCP